MVEGTTDDNEKDEEPEKANHLNVSPTNSINGEKCNATPSDSSDGNDYQALPDIMDHELIYVIRGVTIGPVPNVGDYFRAVHP